MTFLSSLYVYVVKNLLCKSGAMSFLHAQCMKLRHTVFVRLVVSMHYTYIGSYMIEHELQTLSGRGWFIVHKALHTILYLLHTVQLNCSNVNLQCACVLSTLPSCSLVPPLGLTLIRVLFVFWPFLQWT